MLTYRGDKFVKGKKFTINESIYRFSKRDEEKLIFESISDGSKFIMTEDEFNEAERVLTEKINQENKEINNIIGQVLRSKGLAKKYEDVLKSKGITIDYSNPQGVTLTGSNGKVLSASSKEVYGPTKPGHNDTHKENDGWSTRAVERAQKAEQECRDELKTLRSLDDKGLLKYFNTTSLKKAQARKEDSIQSLKDSIKRYRKEYKEELPDAREENRETKLDRRAGHETDVYYRSRYNSKNTADATIDYLNYLTKPDLGKPYKDTNSNQYGHGSKYDFDQEYGEYNSEYFGRNGRPETNKTLDTYHELNNDIENAKDSLSYDSYMTDKELEKKIAKMQKELDKEIEELKKDNQSNKKYHDKKLDNLRERRKALRDFLKSKGVREAVLNFVNKPILTESADESKFEALNREIAEEIDNLIHLAMEADEYGYEALKKAYENAADILENYSHYSDSIYQKEDGTYGRIMSAQEAKDSGIYDVIEKYRKTHNE